MSQSNSMLALPSRSRFLKVFRNWSKLWHSDLLISGTNNQLFIVVVFYYSTPNLLRASFQSKRYFNITNSRNNLRIKNNPFNCNLASWKHNYIVLFYLSGCRRANIPLYSEPMSSVLIHLAFWRLIFIKF